MKKSKIVICLLIVLSFAQINMLAQNEKKNTNQYAMNAISQAVSQYHQQKNIGYKEYRIITMKIMRINKTSGEFVLSYIFYDFKFLNPTHFIHVNNELILVKSDSTCKADLSKYGINKITEKIRKEAIEILPGPNLSITGRDAPLMIFKYDKNELKSKFYALPPVPERKYWF